jgi:flagellar basal-body rod modification protein FlgD
MNVSPVGNNTSTTATTNGTASDQDQFLQLLVTQIQNQNPLDPLDNAEFTSQLSQFAMLEELEQMNASMEQNMVYSQSLNNTMLLGLVGKHAVVEGDEVTVSDGTASSSQVQVSAAGIATVEVIDENGSVVRTFTTEVEPGWNDLEWDGLNTTGATVEDGSYTVSVNVADRAGNALESITYMSGLVESVRFENNLALMSIGGRDYYASEIAKVGI